MHIGRTCVVASTVLVFGLISAPIAPAVARARTMDEAPSVRVLTGELVVTNAARNQFRLVDHGGGFTAPAGLSVEDFSGKPVRVELARDGRVVDIQKMVIHYEPITHGEEFVSGELVVRDPVAGTFTIAGDGRVFVAPASIDIRRFAGRTVQVTLSDRGKVRAVAFAAEPAAEALPPGGCTYNGQEYLNEDLVCQSGAQYRCTDGAWRNLGRACAGSIAQPCTADGVSYADGTSRCDDGKRFVCERGLWQNLGTACTGAASTHIPHTCLLGGSTVADGSSMCRAGTTYRCVDGAWINVGSACS